MGRSSKSQQGGRKTRKAPKAIGQWVKFVKRVAAEEGIKYNKAMKRASERSAAGEKWQTGGNAAPAAAPAAAAAASSTEPAVQQTSSSIVQAAAPITSSPAAAAAGGEPKLNAQAPAPIAKGGSHKTTQKKHKKKRSQ